MEEELGILVFIIQGVIYVVIALVIVRLLGIA